MDVRHIANIRAAIVGVLEGELGPVRIDGGVFVNAVFAEMPIEKIRTFVKGCGARHAFDVRLAPASQHDSSPVSNTGSSEHLTLDVEIVCYTHKRSTLLAQDRVTALDYIIADGDEAKQALSEPGALEATLAGETTIIASGMMLGPGGASLTPSQPRPEETFDQDLVRWQLLGTVILNVPQTVAS